MKTQEQKVYSAAVRLGDELDRFFLDDGDDEVFEACLHFLEVEIANHFQHDTAAALVETLRVAGYKEPRDVGLALLDALRRVM